jgi:hypothetical protein
MQRIVAETDQHRDSTRTNDRRFPGHAGSSTKRERAMCHTVAPGAVGSPGAGNRSPCIAADPTSRRRQPTVGETGRGPDALARLAAKTIGTGGAPQDLVGHSPRLYRYRREAARGQATLRLLCVFCEIGGYDARVDHVSVGEGWGRRHINRWRQPAQ